MLHFQMHLKSTQTQSRCRQSWCGAFTLNSETLTTQADHELFMCKFDSCTKLYHDFGFILINSAALLMADCDTGSCTGDSVSYAAEKDNAPVIQVYSEVCVTDLTEVHVDVFSGLLMKLRAADLLCKVGDADGVAWVELLHEEIATGLHHAVDLVHDSPVHHVNHTLLTNRDACRVCELNEPPHDLRITTSHIYKRHSSDTKA